MTGRVHIVGAGLAGLSAAVHLINQGKSVSLYESTSQAGGRCRSYHDDILNRTIDNGNHLMLSGNLALQEYLGLIGGLDSLNQSETAQFDFYDDLSKERWSLNLGSGIIPWSLFKPENRVPDSRLRDYLAPIKLANAGPDVTVEDCLRGRKHGERGSREKREKRGDTVYERLWHPLTTAVLNTDPCEAQASSLWPVFKQAFAKGSKSCRPLSALGSTLNSTGGLSAALIDPALKWLENQGTEIQFNHRLLSIIVDDNVDGNKVTELKFNTGTVTIHEGDKVILALPPWVAADLIDLPKCPDQHRPIINGHFDLPTNIDKVTIIGLTNAMSQWIFANGDFASVTISAAGPYMALSTEQIAEKMWPEILGGLGLSVQPMPPMGKYRIIREKRATIAQTPDQNAQRPAFNDSGLDNTLLAGDWTDTGLPATIEGAIVSGKIAAAGT